MLNVSFNSCSWLDSGQLTVLAACCRLGASLSHSTGIVRRSPFRLLLEFSDPGSAPNAMTSTACAPAPPKIYICCIRFSCPSLS